MLPATAADAMDGGPDDPGDADFKVSQKREFQHADFSGFARLFDAFCRSFTFQHVYLKRKPIHTKVSPDSCVMSRVFFKQPCLRPGSS